MAKKKLIKKKKKTHPYPTEKIIVHYIFDNPDCTKRDINHGLSHDYDVEPRIMKEMTRTTLNRGLEWLENNEHIFIEDGHYQVNLEILIQYPNIMKKKIINSSQELVILKERYNWQKYNKFRQLLRDLMRANTTIELIKKPNSKEFFFSDLINKWFSDCIFSMIYDCILNNPDLTYAIREPGDLDFKILINCNFSKDPYFYEMYSLVNNYTLVHREIEPDPLNLLSSYLRDRIGKSVPIEELITKKEEFMNEIINDIKNHSLPIEKIKEKMLNLANIKTYYKRTTLKDNNIKTLYANAKFEQEERFDQLKKTKHERIKMLETIKIRPEEDWTSVDYSEIKNKEDRLTDIIIDYLKKAQDNSLDFIQKNYVLQGIMNKIEAIKKHEEQIKRMKPIYLKLIKKEMEKFQDNPEKLKQLNRYKTIIKKEQDPFAFTDNLSIKWHDGKPHITQSWLLKSSDFLIGKVTELSIPKKNPHN